MEKRMQRWIGKSELEVISKVGLPQATYVVEQHKFLRYDYSRVVSVPGFGGHEGFDFDRNCTITVDIVGGVVAAFRLEGNDCIASE